LLLRLNVSRNTRSHSTDILPLLSSRAGFSAPPVTGRPCPEADAQ
jgi:hypothetical protein